MLLVVFQAVKIKIHFGELLLSALLLCQKINHDMLWSEWLHVINPFFLRKIYQYNVVTFCMNFQGVGYPLDIVVCSALGADMYDCVYPTRTARFGTALVPEVIIFIFFFILLIICNILSSHTQTIVVYNIHAFMIVHLTTLKNSSFMGNELMMLSPYWALLIQFFYCTYFNIFAILLFFKKNYLIPLIHTSFSSLA